MNLDQRISDYLAANNDTMDGLAKKLGMTRVSLRHKIDGQPDFWLSEAIVLSKLLGCSVYEIADSRL